MAVCKLCNKDRELEESHIIPKFIFKWLKQTGTGFLRGSWNFNVRVQDGIKAPFLCGDCEDLLSESETYFSKAIFFPVVNKNADYFEYDERLFYFAISVMWRLLKHSLLEEEKEQIFYEKLKLAEREWQDFLLTKESIPTFNKLHLFIGVDVAEEDSTIEIPERFIDYMGRYVDAGIADNDTGEDCLFFLKLPRFLFIVPIHGIDDDKMINTLISPHKGDYLVNECRIENPMIGEFFLERVKVFDKMIDKISPIQREKMRSMGLEKWDEMENKDLRNIIEYKRRKESNL